MANDVIEKIEPIYVRIGGAIRTLRHEAGWTQEDVAAQSGLTRTSIVNIEMGRQRVMLHTLEELAHAFGVSLRQLLGEVIEVATDSERAKRLRAERDEAVRQVSQMRVVMAAIEKMAREARS